MQVETFRYLMSALAPVYGALIFGVAVFVVLRHQLMRSHHDRLIARLGSFVVETDVPEKRFPKSSARLQDIEFRVFAGLDESEIASRVERALLHLAWDESHSAPGRQDFQTDERARLKNGITQSHGRFRAQLRALSAFRSQACAALGVPAALCWSFAAWLMGADLLQILKSGELLTVVAAESVLAASLGVVYLVWAAVGMLGEPGVGDEASVVSKQTDEGDLRG